MKKLLAIDPSINFCGVAVFDIKKKELEHASLIVPDKVIKRDGEWYDKARSISDQIKTIVADSDIDRIVCELPEHWSVAGFAARESGSIQKLNFVCGMIYSAIHEVEIFEFIIPRGWKGQLSKEVCKNRLTEFYAGKGKFYTVDEWEKLNHNVVDSIGIAHWRIFGRV